MRYTFAGLLGSGLGLLVHDDPAHPVLVWRVQNAQGHGPYELRGRQLVLRPEIERVIDALTQTERVAYFTESSRRRQPVPQKDFIEWLSRSPEERAAMHYGFESPESARSWFGRRGLAVLAKAGFVLTQVPAAKVYSSISHRQLWYLPVKEK